MKINPDESEALRFTRAWVKTPLGYFLGDQKIREASSCKYLGIILRSDLNWVDQVNYVVQNAWKALHFVMRILKKVIGIQNFSLRVFGTSYSWIWVLHACDPCREGQINALDLVQRKAAQFANYTKDSHWEILALRRTIARLCALFQAYSGERPWRAIRDRLRRPYYLSRFDHVQKIRDRKQRTDIGKYSFVNRTIKNWNQLPAEAFGAFPCKT